MVHDVFISYRRETGSEISGYIQSELLQAGFVPFLDIDEKYSGEYKPIIISTIENCDLFVIILTKNSIAGFKDEKNASRLELETAIMKNKEILPINALGETLFTELKEEGLPSCVKYLSELNIMDYNERYRKPAIEFIKETLFNIRKRKFATMSFIGNDFVSKIQGSMVEVKDQEVQGFSMNPRSSQERYTGTIKLGNPYGKGTLVLFTEQLEYNMDWTGCGTGTGVITDLSENKVLYKGSILNGKFEGFGELILSNREKYEGNFHLGKLIYGTIIKDEEIYEGYITCDNDYFSGKFNPLYHGYGHIRRTSLEKGIIKNIEYSGNFHKGKYQGLGTLLAILEKKIGDNVEKLDKVTYEGDWLSGTLINGVINRESANGDKTLWSGKFSPQHRRLQGDGFAYIKRKEFKELFNVNTKLEELFGIDFVKFCGEEDGEDYVYLQCEYDKGLPVAGKFTTYNSKGLREITGKFASDKKNYSKLYMIPSGTIKGPKGQIIVNDYDTSSKVIDIEINLKDIGNYKGKIREDHFDVEYTKYTVSGTPFEDNKIFTNLSNLEKKQGIKISWDGSTVNKINALEMKPNKENLETIKKYKQMTEGK